MTPYDDRLGFFTALENAKRVWKAKNARTIEIPTPRGTFVFHRAKTTQETAIARICERLNVSPMTLANWLKDWNREPLNY